MQIRFFETNWRKKEIVCEREKERERERERETNRQTYMGKKEIKCVFE